MNPMSSSSAKIGDYEIQEDLMNRDGTILRVLNYNCPLSGREICSGS